MFIVACSACQRNRGVSHPGEGREDLAVIGLDARVRRDFLVPDSTAPVEDEHGALGDTLEHPVGLGHAVLLDRAAVEIAEEREVQVLPRGEGGRYGVDDYDDWARSARIGGLTLDGDTL